MKIKLVKPSEVAEGQPRFFLSKEFPMWVAPRVKGIEAGDIPLDLMGVDPGDDDHYVCAVEDTDEPVAKQVWYVAHPVSGDAIGNVFKVIRWVKWLTEHDPTRVYIAPWVAEVLAYPVASPEVYERALQGDEAVIAHLDGIIMVGDPAHRSTGIERERTKAMKTHKYVVDMRRYLTPEDVEPDFELEPAE